MWLARFLSLPARWYAQSTSTMGCSTSKFNALKRSVSGSSDEHVEAVVCNDADIAEGEMKAFNVDDIGRVLVVRQNGQLHALGGKCTHYGAPLEKGALGEGRVRCPWHGACFNITTGDIEDFPGLDSLPCYKIVDANPGEIKIQARKKDLASSKRVKPHTTPACRAASHFVIIGGGTATATCIETLRQEGFAGRITVIAKENALPYDRVKLSKAFDVEVDKIQLRDERFYKELGVTFLKGICAVKLDTSKHNVILDNNETIAYNKVFIATGSTAAKLKIPGAELTNVVTLREIADCELLNKTINAEMDAIVIGSSFIAMECAAYLAGKVKSVTVIGRDSVPFKAVLGEKIGNRLMNLFIEKGVQFKMNANVAECIGNESAKVRAVKLANDLGELKADLVLMGVGGQLNTQFLNDSGVKLLKNGAIDVNQFMQSNIENVYAGGDVAYAPLHASKDKASIGHFGLAHYHGKVAAMNMLDKNYPIKAVPFFWTMLFGKGIRYSGHGSFNDVLFAGDVGEFKFAAYYLNGDEVTAMASCGMDPIVSEYAERVYSGRKLMRQDLGDDLMKWRITSTR